MKRFMSILLAMFMFCLSVIIPMPITGAESTVTAVQKEDIFCTIRNWVGEDMPSGFYDPNGNQLFPFDFTFGDWKEVYTRTGDIFSVCMEIKAPEGTTEGKVLALEVPEIMLGNPSEEQLDKLLNEGTFAAVSDGSIPVEIEIADLFESDNGKQVSVVPRRKFVTVLVAWKDAQERISMQKLGVVVMHSVYEEIVLKDNGEFIKEKMTPFGREDSVAAAVEYLEAEQGQLLPYITSMENGSMIVDLQLRKSDYEKIYAAMPEEAEGSYLSVEIVPPEGAASYAIWSVGYAGEDVAQELLDSSFETLREGQQHVGIGLEYAVAEHKDNKVVIRPRFFEHNVMVAWKDQAGNLINVGAQDDARYVEHLRVVVVPNDEEPIEIELETNAEPSVMMLYGREAAVLVKPEFMPPVQEGEEPPYRYTLQNGVLDIVTEYSAEDYQNVYAMLPGGTEQLYMAVEVTPPEGAKYFNVASTGYPDESVAKGLMELNKDHYQQLNEWRTTAGRGYEFAILRRYDESILVEPTGSQQHLIVTWLDEDRNHINIGTEDHPRFVEHLIINIQSENTDFVQAKDNAYIEESDIRFNTNGWENELFIKKASYSNGKVSYYVSISELEKILQENGGVVPEKYRYLTTGVRAPKDVAAYDDGGDQPHPIKANELVERGYRWHFQENNGEWSIGDLINMGMWEFAWVMKDGTRIPQKLSVEVTLVSDETWMEAGGWNAVSNDRILVNPDLNGSYGMIIKKDDDGEGHAYNHFTGNPVNEEKLRNIDVFVGLEAPEIMDASGEPVEIVGYKANGSSGANVYIVKDHVIEEQKQFLENARVKSFDMNIEGFEGKKIVPINDLATFASRRLRAENGVLMDVYFYETYGTSIDNGNFCVINWIGKNDEVVAKEFFYHTNDGETRSYKAKGKNAKDITNVVTEATVLNENCVLHVEIPIQSVVENEAAAKAIEEDKGAQYFQMTLENADGDVIRPDEEGVEILLPYPEGIHAENADQYDFAVEHFANQSYMERQKLKAEVTENGLLFTATDFSPFLLSWSRKRAGAINESTQVTYAELDTALKAMKENERVRLLGDAETEVLFVGDGILDLNGFTVKADYVIGFGGIVDDSRANTGLLAVPEDCMMLQQDNAQLPLLTPEGYRFVEVTAFNAAYVKEEEKLAFQPLFDAEAVEMLAGTEKSNLDIAVRVCWKKNGAERMQDFVYSDEQVRQYLSQYNSETGKFDLMLTLHLYGTEGLEELKYIPIVKSNQLVGTQVVRRCEVDSTPK